MPGARVLLVIEESSECRYMISQCAAQALCRRAYMEILTQVSFGRGRRLLLAAWLSLCKPTTTGSRYDAMSCDLCYCSLLSVWSCLGLVCRCAACVCPSPCKRTSRAKPSASVDLYPRTSTTGHNMVQLTIQDMELHRMMSL